MKKIVIVKNNKISDGDRLVEQILPYFDGFECVVASSANDARRLVSKGAYAVICLGGDGTILAIADAAADSDTPILGINHGHLGYMAGLEADEIHLLEKIKAGSFELEERFMLSAEVKKQNGLVLNFRALNEILVSRGIAPKLLELELSCDGSKVARFRADGLIVSTPTGSTAYALSAGGAIIDPATSSISVCPICQHSFTGGRSIVFSPTSRLEIEILPQCDSDTYLSADGKTTKQLENGDKISISAADKTVKFIKLKNNAFYQTLYKKFNAGE